MNIAKGDAACPVDEDIIHGVTQAPAHRPQPFYVGDDVTWYPDERGRQRDGGHPLLKTGIFNVGFDAENE